ncbi:MAG: hypothetical protein RR575_13140 [Acinetobacter sp.]
MYETHGIAERIVKIILSPESVTGFTDGMLSIPRDIGYAAYGVLDTETKYQRQGEMIRLLTAIKNGILHRDNFAKIMEIITSIFNNYIPKERQDRFFSHTTSSFVGRAFAGSTVAQQITKSILKNSGYSSVGRILAGGQTLLILPYGMMQRCIYRSMALSEKSPDIYNQLRYPNDLDLLYAFLEEYINPFIDGVNLRKQYGQNEFNNLLALIDKKMNDKAGY